jgi:two-component system, OmpR family, response regulator MprA
LRLAGGVNLRTPLRMKATKATVLVVDDELDIRLTLAQILREEGFRVRLACNGLEALERVAEEEPDLVLLDLIMPIVNGWEVLRTLRSSRKDLPIVVLSAVPFEDGADYIPKPVSYARLLQLLETVRARVRARAAND